MKSWRRLRSWSRGKIRNIGGRSSHRRPQSPKFGARGTRPSECSNPQIRQGVADGVDDLDELGMRFLEAVHRRAQSLKRMFQRLRILPGAGGFVGGNLREAGDAFGLFIVRFRQLADLGLERAEQLEQFAFVFFAHGVRAADFRLNFANGFFDHGFRPKLTVAANSASREKNIYQRPTRGRIGPDQFPDVFADGFDSARAIHHAHAVGFSGGDGLVTLGHAVKEMLVAFLQPVADKGQGGLARAQAFGADFRRHVQQQGQIGPRVADGKINHALDQRQVQSAAITLIRRGRIVKAVAQDNFADREGGADGFADELRPAGIHQQQFGFIGHRHVGLAVFERVADFAEAMAAYLKTLPPVRNAVPAPLHYGFVETIARKLVRGGFPSRRRRR